MVYLKLLKHTNVLNASIYFDDTRTGTRRIPCTLHIFQAEFIPKAGVCSVRNTMYYPRLFFLHGKVYIFKSLADQSMMCKSMRNKLHKSLYIEVEIVTSSIFATKEFFKTFFLTFWVRNVHRTVYYQRRLRNSRDVCTGNTTVNVSAVFTYFNDTGTIWSN